MAKAEKAEPPKNVYEAINQVQAGLAEHGITKSRKNKDQGYSFRGIDDVYNALSGLMAEAKLCVLPRVLSRELVERKTAKGNPLFYVVVDVEFDFVCSADGSKHTVKTFGEAMDTADKATNKAMSAAYKYACLQAFCIPTEGDNDADATTHEVAPVKSDLFESDQLRELFTANCIDAINKAGNGQELRDQKDLNLAKWNAMKESPAKADVDAYAVITRTYNAKHAELKEAALKKKTVSDMMEAGNE